MNEKTEIILLVGASNSGKTTFANLALQSCPTPFIYINADKMRGLIGKDESDQSVNGLVFATLERMCDYLMSLNKPIIVDCTNYNKKNRKLWVALAKKYNYKLAAVILNTKIEECIARNEKRDRKVPVEIIQKHFDNFEVPTLEEGFESIEYTDGQKIIS